MGEGELYEVADCMNEMQSKLNPLDDCQTIANINNKIQDIRQFSTRKQENNQKILRELAERLDEIKKRLEDPEISTTAQEYSDRLVGLDRKKFAMARGINELEGSMESMEATLRSLREEHEALEEEERRQAAVPEDDTFLKLKIYKSLGIELVQDGNGKYSKCRVLSTPRNDIHTVVLDPQIPRFELTNMLWEMCT